MRNSRYIVSIDQTSGLPPSVVNVLNGNFWNLLGMIEDPEIVMVAGINAPDPRTDETLWYKTDTGGLYIWSLTHASTGPGDPDVWGWVELATMIDDSVSAEAEIRQQADEDLYELIQQSATTDYEYLDNKPSIESVTLVGNKTFPQLGIFIDSDEDMDGYPDSDMYALTVQDINALWNGGL